MLTVKDLGELIEGLDPGSQVVVGIINGPRFDAAYAALQVCARAEAIDADHRVLREQRPALYICCYEEPRPWEGPAPADQGDGTATLEFDPENS